MGTAELPVLVIGDGYEARCFYSLSRDGDSGTAGADPARTVLAAFLFAVARWGQRNYRE